MIVGGAAYGAYLYLPTATISLTPGTQPFGPMSFDITADPSVAVADPATGKVPAEHVAIPLAETATFDATGHDVVQTKAQGTVTFTSTDTFFDVPVPDGTVVSTRTASSSVTTDSGDPAEGGTSTGRRPWTRAGIRAVNRRDRAATSTPAPSPSCQSRSPTCWSPRPTHSQPAEAARRRSPASPRPTTTAPSPR